MDTSDTLWGAPEPIRERLNLKGRDTEWTEFLLCGFYCSVAVTFLVIFGIAAVMRGEISYAIVIFGFAMATCLIYGSIWLSGMYHLARHFVVTLMGTLCLFLFFSGGTENTGPLYFFIFPIVAVFLQGFRQGSFSVGILLLTSLFVLETGVFGFDRDRYTFVFISRVFTIYLIIAILSALFAWFRERAERELLLSQEDLASLTHADLLTGLANRDFMTRLIHLEFARFKRYGTGFCLLALQIDDFDRFRSRYGTDFSNSLVSMLAQLLLQTLRTLDTPARWETNTLLILLPQASLESAGLMAQRLRDEVRKKTRTTGSISISIGISEVDDSPEQTISVAEKNLEIAARDGGGSVISGRQAAPVKMGAPGLSSYFRDNNNP